MSDVKVRLMSELYEKLNQAWKQTCKIVLGDEVGELSEYKPWLKEIFKEYYSPEYGAWRKAVESKLTDKEVYIFAPFYKKDVKFAEYDLLKNKKIEPLSIDEIKDIDTILDAWKERWYYRASVVLGRSAWVEESDSVFNSTFVYRSYGITGSSYIAYTLWMRDGSKYVFGSGNGLEYKFSIRSSYGANITRGVGAYYFANVSDIYFSHYIFDSNEVMFSFNQIGKRYVIGNLQLSKEKYLQVKKGLLEQIRDKLIKDKRFPSTIELVEGSSAQLLPLEGIKKEAVESEKCTLEPIKEGFKKTTTILLGEPFELSELEDYLRQKRVGEPLRTTTPSGRTAVFYKVLYHNLWKSNIKKRIIVQAEVEYAAKVHLELNDILSLGTIMERIGSIAYICQSLRYKSYNVCDVPAAHISRDVAYYMHAMDNKVAAYNYIGSPSSSYIFGSFFTTNSSFIINSDVNENLQRTVGADRCSNSSDIYFSHDIDGSTEVMFSQHLKGARYTIGNLALEKEKYLSIKAKLLSQIVDELKSKGKLHFSVKSMGV